MALYKLQCRNKGNGKSSTRRIEWSETVLVDCKGGGLSLRTSSRQSKRSEVFWREGRLDQPVIASQREMLSSRPSVDNRA